MLSMQPNKHSVNQYGPGIFIDEVTIVDALAITPQTMPKYLTRIPDVGVTVQYSIGKDFNPTLDIFGDFKRDGNGITDWGSAFKVRDLFAKLGWTEQFDPERGITPEMIEFLKGKKMKRLSYVKGLRVDGSGRFNYADWTEIAGPNETAESLAARFLKSVAKGYPQNYHPEVLNAPSAPQAGTGEPATEEEEVF